MGQVQSDSSDANMEESSSAAKPTQESSSPASMESLMAEAAAFGNEDENASLDEKAQKALDCPCLADLRKGPCGSQFSGAFLCFLKSTAEEKIAPIVTNTFSGFNLPRFRLCSSICGIAELYKS
ncbi:mitochondrial intermembrane space import and assembly protein 40 homolog isoform X2 [Daucus carota subsp. sativus]|uniref:mitochondrial intermembrane space import and assembly protein 40 homolog isoform X2 n=1 Tax=Daucus carota subsp. sativus TaxID=79200 RepID=UPI0007EFC74B|nr:PREDICTED: mitochondrial intermembrane space import and assembly protein 40 isoform X2 [Daucus carota subsp. sativus]